MRQRFCGGQIFEESEKDYYILKVYIYERTLMKYTEI